MMMNAPWFGFSFLARPHSRLMMSWIAIARRTGFLGRRGDRFVKRVGVQAVAVVVDGDQRLQRGADVVELNLLRVQAAAAGLDVVFQLLAALVWRRISRASPPPRCAARTRPSTVYSGSMPLEKKNDRFGAKSSMCMPRAR